MGIYESDLEEPTHCGHCDEIVEFQEMHSMDDDWLCDSCYEAASAEILDTSDTGEDIDIY